MSKRKKKKFYYGKRKREKPSQRKQRIVKFQVDDLNINKIVGTFQQNKKFGFVVPDSRKIPTDIYIAKKDFKGAKDNQRVIVEITKPAANGKKLEGKVLEVIGDADQAGIDMQCIIREYDLPYEFPQDVINELKKQIENVKNLNFLHSYHMIHL